MILVLSGTRDGRDIIDNLTASGHDVIATVVSEYGAALMDGNGVSVVTGTMDKNGLIGLIADKGIKLIVDATHPYADKVSEMAQEIADLKNIKCLRYQRPESTLPKNKLIFRVPDYQAAARKAVELGEIIFLTTGTKTLDIFTSVAKEKCKRVIARVLPEVKSISHCLSCGLQPIDIIAMQGPFSLEMNIAMLRQTAAEVLVTKDSGQIGGTDTKVEAALGLNIPVVLIERPPLKGEIITDLSQLMLQISHLIK